MPDSVVELSVLFTDDTEIFQLNAEYRHKESPTDVLSFSQLEGASLGGELSSLGDLVISLDTAERQAVEYGVTLHAEILRLLIHGILHLFGYDHENVPPEEVRAMQELEDKLFAVHSPELPSVG